MNSIKCKSCHHENPLFNLNCENCNSILRDKIVNIDLWNIIGKIVESPTEAFRIIIQAENKNFITFLFLLEIFKGLLMVRVSVPYLGFELFISPYFFILYPFYFIVSILVLSLVVTMITKRWKMKTRFKDNLSLTIYSFLPMVFSLLLLFPLEIAVFGESLFSSNPSPFLVKEYFAYLFLSLEGILILWTIILLTIAFRVQFKRVLIAATYSIFILFVVFVLPFILENFSKSIF